MDIYVNRYRRFENTTSSGYDFLVSDSNIWDRRVKQWINLFISEGATRSISFLAPVKNDYDKQFISFGTINPDTHGKYDLNGRLNYWVDLALVSELPLPPFAFDVLTSTNYISDFLDKVETNELSMQYDISGLLARKLVSPSVLKLHNNTEFAEKCLHVIANFYLSRDKKLVLILDDNNYDKNSTSVCRAIFENAPLTKKVYYISYTNDINRLCNNNVCNLFCCPASERNSIPKNDSLLVVDLVDGQLSPVINRSLMKDIIKCGLMGDFNLFVRDHLNDHLVSKLYKLNNPNSISSLTYLYINSRGLIKFRPDKNVENNILDYLNKLRLD